MKESIFTIKKGKEVHRLKGLTENAAVNKSPVSRGEQADILQSQLDTLSIQLVRLMEKQTDLEQTIMKQQD